MSKLILNSSASMGISLQAIRKGAAGLSKRRKALLERAPNIGDWGEFTHETVEIHDLAYLSAATKHEFALLRSRKADILYHGSATQCRFEGDLYSQLMDRTLELVAHSHPGEIVPAASKQDRDLLISIDQKSSQIISGMTGMVVTFRQNQFDD